MGTGGLTQTSFVGTGGRRIAWHRWEPPAGDARATLVIVHGFGEHGGRYGHVADRLVSEGVAVYALDHHGHGRSEGARARISFSDAVADIDQLVTQRRDEAPERPLFLLGHSMGGALALRYALAHQARLDGLILSGPLVEVEGRAAAKLLGRAIGALLPGVPVARLDPNQVSRDPAVVSAYVNDPLVHHDGVPAVTAAEFLKHAATLPDVVGQIQLPTLLLYGTADRLCSPSGSLMVAERIGTSDLTTHAYDGLYHEILNEPERDRVLDDICAWLDAHVDAAATP